MYLQGKLQAEIAEELGLSQSTISNDLASLHQEWIKTAVSNFDEVKARELARIDQLEREYWQAWQRSLKNEETAIQKQIETAAGLRKEAMKKARGQAGDPRFLDGIQWCIEQRLKIFGIYEATKLKIFGWQDEVLALIRDGRITLDDARQELGDELATELFERVGIPAVAS
jgi:hypothetical protein